MSDNVELSYDVIASFYGLIGRQRKIQKQMLIHENFETKPSFDDAVEIAKSLISKHNARKINENKISLIIRKFEIHDRGDGFPAAKTTMLFDNDWEDVYSVIL